MKRSEINRTYRAALRCFETHGWTLPPQPRWDITDCGLGFDQCVIALINLAEEPEYSEKLIYCVEGKPVPLHAHQKKKEDIICRWGAFDVELWAGDPRKTPKGTEFTVKKTGKIIPFRSGEIMRINAGERITIETNLYHAFWATTPEAIIGEVSTANDDLHDNFFVDERIGRFSAIIEDEAKEISLLNE